MSSATQPAELAKALNWQPFKPQRLVELLWPKVAQKLSRAELLAIIDGGSDYTAEAARNSARVVEGVAHQRRDKEPPRCLPMRKSTRAPQRGRREQPNG